MLHNVETDTTRKKYLKTKDKLQSDTDEGTEPGTCTLK